MFSHGTFTAWSNRFGRTGGRDGAAAGGAERRVRSAAVAAVEPLEARALFAVTGLDPTFGGGTGRTVTDFRAGNDTPTAVALLPGGKFVVAGTVGAADGQGNSDVGLARYNADGTPDKTFGGGTGRVVTHVAGDDAAAAVVVLADGRIVVAGTATRTGAGGSADTDVALVRYTAGGSLDTTFSGDGKVTLDLGGPQDAVAGLALLAGGKLLVGGTAQGMGGSSDNADFAAAQLNADGSVDLTYGGGDGKVTADGGGRDVAAAMAVRADGSVLIGGSSSEDAAVARFTAGGTPDGAFGGDGIVTTDVGGDSDRARALHLLPNGDVLAFVNRSEYSDPRVVMVRYRPDGAPAAVYGDGPAAPWPAQGNAALIGNQVAALPGGRFAILTAGSAGPGVAAYNPDGSLHAEVAPFEGGGPGGAVAALADGRLLVATGQLLPNTDSNAAFATVRVKALPASADPDDQIVEAVPATVGGPAAAGAITAGTDADMFAFAAKAGQRVGFDVDRPAGSRLDSLVRVFDVTGRELARNDDAPAPGEPGPTDDAYVSHYFGTAGTYYVGVSGSPNAGYDPRGGAGDSSGSAGAYALALTALPVAPDTNDQIAEAIPLAAGTPAKGTIGPDGDVNLYRVTATAAGQRVTLDLDLPASPTLTGRLRLFDAGGRELAADQGGVAPGEAGNGSREAFLRYTLPTAGAYYAGVSAGDNAAYGAVTGTGDVAAAGGAYTLHLAIAPPDPDDQIAEAAPLPAGKPVSATIESDLDVDLYEVTSATAGTTRVELKFATGGLALRAFTAGGEPVWAYQYESNIWEVETSADGTYYLGVAGDTNYGYDPVTGGNDAPGRTGPYTLTVLAPAAADPDDQIAEAAALAVGGSKADAIGSPTDADLFAVRAAAGQRLGFDLDRAAGSPLNGYLRVFDAAGRELAAADDAAAPGETAAAAGPDPYVEYTFTAAGTYYVGVSGVAPSFNGNRSYDPLTGENDQSGGTAGAYTLRATTRPAFADTDPDNQIREAVPVPVGGSRANAVDRPTDVDLFKVVAAAGQELSIGVVTTVLNQPTLRLFDSAGRELAVGGFPTNTFRHGFAAAGTYYVGVSGPANRGYDPVTGANAVNGDGAGAYVLTVAAVAPDPDDQRAEAKAFTAGTVVTGALSDGADVDAYKFQAAAGVELSIDVLDGPAAVRLFDAAGAPLDVPTYFGGRVVRFTPDAAGTFYVGLGADSNGQYSLVTGFGDAAGNGVGGYRFRVTTAAAADEDDQTREARAVAAGTPAAGRIDRVDDVDLYRFQVAAGQELFWRARPTAGDGSYLGVRLFDAAGAPVPDASDRRVFAAAGTYYLGVAYGGNAGYDAVTGGNDYFYDSLTPAGYELTLTVVPPDADDQIREARPLALGTTRADTIASGTDVDLHAVTVKAGQRVGFDLDRPAGSPLNGWLRLFDAAGRELAYDDNSPAPGEPAGTDPYIEYVFAAAGTFYVGVSNGTNGGYNPVDGTADAFDPDALGLAGGYSLRATIL